MNILQVLSSKTLGGIEQVNLDYYTLLRDRGHSVTLCMHPEAQTLAEARRLGARVLTDPVVSGGFALARPLAWLKYRRLIAREKISTIIMHNGKPRPLFQAAARGRCPVIGVCHNENFKQRLRMDGAICVNSAMLGRFRAAARQNGDSPQFSFHVPNPLSTTVPPAGRLRKWEASDTVVIGGLCRMTRKKGLHVLLQAARGLHDMGVRFRLVLGGEGVEMPVLKAMASDLRIAEHVSFPGWISDRDAFFDELDIFCLPSLREPFGLVVTEAMIRGCPVVVSDADGPRDIVDDGKTGLMVAKDNPEQLATALKALIDAPDHAAGLAEAGRQTVLERFGRERVGHVLETAIRDVIAGSAASS